MNSNIGKNTNSVGKSMTNTASRVYQRARGMSTLEMIILVVILFVIILIIYFWAKSASNESKRKSRNSPILVGAPRNAYGGQLGRRPQKVPNPTEGLSFSYSMWIYVADWNYNFGKIKNILVKGDDDKYAPKLQFHSNTNTLYARINVNGPNGSAISEGCDIANFPLQKWVHLVYILNNRSVDIYIDGKLERSCVLSGVPLLNNSPVHICQSPSYWGQISKLQYFTKALYPHDVSRIYSEGPFPDSSYKVSFGGEDLVNVNSNYGNNSYL
jgi:hypothetical protein